MLANSPRVTIVIVAPGMSCYLDEALAAIQAVEEPSWEAIVVLDEPHQSEHDSHITFIASGSVGPAEKRDLGAARAKAPIIAFLDDDAYPAEGWMASALTAFDDPSVAAVGGPGETPPGDSFWQRVSGEVLASWLVSGPVRHRYVAEAPRDVDDFPSMNLFVRRSVFESVGGFDSTFYPGEDTKLCLEIVRSGGRILYDPRALVFHHRRPLIPGHLRQVAAYGKHRGNFAKRLPETSRRATYFVPSAWLVGLVLGRFAGRRWTLAMVLYRAVVGLYVALALLAGSDTTRRSADLRLGMCTVVGIILTHLVYGAGFIYGLIVRDP